MTYYFYFLYGNDRQRLRSDLYCVGSGIKLLCRVESK